MPRTAGAANTAGMARVAGMAQTAGVADWPGWARYGPEEIVAVYLAHGVPDAEASQFRGHPVHLDTFEGPLDLLLHLIKRDQVEIWEISIARITRQYLEYLATLHAMNIEVAGDFLVMAATLMRIKSQNLLPRPSALPETDEDAEPLTREGLIARLVEYKKYREAARSLLRMEAAQVRRHPVGVAASVGAGHAYPLREPRLIDLFEYLRDLLDRKEPAPGHHVRLEEIRLEDQLEWVRDRMASGEEFEEIPGGPGAGIPFIRLLRRPWLRMEIAVTFLAILELARLQQLRLWQRRALEEIWILVCAVPEVAPGPSLSVADEEMT
jgi:segregation and condensation protein A